MIIGIDGNEANVRRKVGISEFAYELLLQFSKWQLADSTWQIYLKSSPGKELPETADNWQYRVIGPKKLWTQFALPLHLYIDRPRPAVFFTPTHYAPRFSPVPTVVSIMDLSYIHFPSMFTKKDLYQLQQWSEYSIRQAAKVITISESSKNDIIKQYSLSPEKVVVVYPGIKATSDKKQVKSMDEIKKKYQISDRYILFVGTLQPRKNIARLIEAYSLLAKEKAYHDVSLIVVGKKGWQYEPILKAPETFGVKEQVKFLDFVSDEDLASLYSHAVCYVLPSLYEGFGLPVLEAMKHDCPVITSNISSLPEAGGDACLYVNPEDPSDIAQQIRKLLDNEKLRETMIAKGREQIKKFSWEKAAKETLDVLQHVANSK